MLATNILRCNNIYDIMANCYNYLLKDSNFSLTDFNLEQTEYTKNIDEIFNLYLECQNTNVINSFKELKKQLSNLVQKENYISKFCFNVIKSIDECIQYSYLETGICDSLFNSYPCLNHILREEIIILPIVTDNFRERIDCIYKKEYLNSYLRKIKAFDNNSINKYLENYIIFRKKDLKKYELVIHELNAFDDFTNKIYTDELLIAICPITNRNIHDIFEIEYNKNYTFSIKPLKEETEQYIVNKCVQFVNSIKVNVDFLIFPEMFMNNNIISSIKKAINISKVDIPFIIFGSIWDNGANKSLVCYRNQEIFYYHKKIPFDLQYTKKEFESLIKDCHDKQQKKIMQKLYTKFNFEKNKISFRENLNDICEQNNKIHLIDINGFGRIFTFICKDIDDENYMNVTKMLRGDCILLPACTPSNDLSSNAKHLAECFHYTTIMANTCSAICKSHNDTNTKIASNKSIGFIITPEKCSDSRSAQSVYYKFDKACKECSKICKGRIFSINLNNFQNLDDKISLKIKELQ